MWVGVDLDGTLAEYHGERNFEHIGAPVPAMVARVKKWIAEGIEVRIFTARVSELADLDAAVPPIKAWCREHLGRELPITCSKDFECAEIWDNQAIHVITNTGEPVLPPAT